MNGYIIFEGAVDQQATQRLNAAIDKLTKANVEKIEFFFSSLGGNIYEGFILASIMQNSRVPIAAHATNHIDSIANVIYLASKERTAESYAKFYLHGASTPQGVFDEKTLIDQLSAIRANNNRIAHFISENSGAPLKKIQSMMKTGVTISAQEALTLKVVQKIVHKEIPKDAAREEIIYIN